MKWLCLLFALPFPHFANAITLNAGESFTWSFDSMDYFGQANYSPGSSFGIEGNGDFIQGDDLLLMQVFEGDSSEAPYFECINCYGAHVLVPLAWQDLQGAITITMIEGSVTFDFMFARYLTGTYEYRTTLNVSSVPVPAATWLLASGLLSLIGFSKRKTLGVLSKLYGRPL